MKEGGREKGKEIRMKRGREGGREGGKEEEGEREREREMRGGKTETKNERLRKKSEKVKTERNVMKRVCTFTASGQAISGELLSVFLSTGGESELQPEYPETDSLHLSAPEPPATGQCIRIIHVHVHVHSIRTCMLYVYRFRRFRRLFLRFSFFCF